MKFKFKKILITGASSGIGEACARQFAKEGAHLLLAARRGQRLQSLADELIKNYGIEVEILIADVKDLKQLEQSWFKLPQKWREIDVLINNAGLALGMESVQDANPADWDQVIDTNLKGVLYMSRLVIKEMLARQTGHIINMGSVAGYQVYPGGSVYCAVKFALRGISDGIKMDVHGTPIRVTLINPGMVAGTEFSDVRFRGDALRKEKLYENTQPLYPEDIADLVVYCAASPQHVDIREVLIMPTAQTAVQMVHRAPELDKILDTI